MRLRSSWSQMSGKNLSASAPYIHPILFSRWRRSSWSKMYGNDGFIKLKRGSGDCGIASDAIAAVVSKDLMLRPGADSRRLEAVREW